MAATSWVLFGCLALTLAAGTLGGADDVSEEDLERLARIIGGNEVTDPTKWPWLVSLEGTLPHTKLGPIPIIQTLASCGASVLNDRWLLSAAHCFDGNDGRNPSHWTARLATLKKSPGILDYLKHVIGKIFKKEKWVLWNMDVEKILIHPQYSRKHFRNDIALLKLKKSVPSGDKFEKIHRVQLPEQGDITFPRANQMCVVKGWGCSEKGGSSTSRAYQVSLPVRSFEDCRWYWSSVDHTKQVCAGTETENKGPCPGDSGGPLVCQRGDHWVQVGVVSYGSARSGAYPDVLTRVSHYVGWINSIMENM